MINWAR